MAVREVRACTDLDSQFRDWPSRSRSIATRYRTLNSHTIRLPLARPCHRTSDWPTSQSAGVGRMVDNKSRSHGRLDARAQAYGCADPFGLGNHRSRHSFTFDRRTQSAGASPNLAVGLACDCSPGGSEPACLAIYRCRTLANVRTLGRSRHVRAFQAAAVLLRQPFRSSRFGDQYGQSPRRLCDIACRLAVDCVRQILTAPAISHSMPQRTLMRLARSRWLSPSRA